MLPLFTEKWIEKKHCYLKAALASSVFFGLAHLTWTVRELAANGTVSSAILTGNLYQVFYTFYFGILACGIAFTVRSTLPIVFWHTLVNIAAYLYTGLLSPSMNGYYTQYNLLNLKNVFEKYQVLSQIPYADVIVRLFIDVIFWAVGGFLILRAEKRFISNQK